MLGLDLGFNFYCMNCSEFIFFWALGFHYILLNLTFHRFYGDICRRLLDSIMVNGLVRPGPLKMHKCHRSNLLQ